MSLKPLLVSFFLIFLNFCIEACSGKVYQYPFGEGDSFTGYCDGNGNLVEGSYISQDNDRSYYFLGTYLNNVPYMGRLEIESNDDMSIAMHGVFNNDTNTFVGLFYINDIPISFGAHSIDSFELNGFGGKISDTSFDMVIGLFKEGKIVGKAKYYNEESDDVLLAEYLYDGKITSSAYLITEEGEKFTLNYQSNRYIGKSNGWQSDYYAEAIDDYIIENFKLFQMKQDTSDAEYERVYQLIDSEFSQDFDPDYVEVKPENNKRILTGTGSGFFVSEELVVTNNHVVYSDAEFKEQCKVLKGRKGFEEFMLRVVSQEPNTDLALLRSIDHKNKEYATIRARGIRKGERVISVGYPLANILGEGTKVTEGRISSLSGTLNDTALFQMSADIVAGNSGGPLFDDKGNLIGVSVSGIQEELRQGSSANINFGIKSLTLLSFLETNNVKADEKIFTRFKSLPDIVEDAEKFTLLIECYE